MEDRMIDPFNVVTHRFASPPAIFPQQGPFR
jgi:hypothetical protein